MRDFFTAISGDSKTDSSGAKQSKGATVSKGSTPVPVMRVGHTPSPSPTDPQELLIMFDEFSESEDQPDEGSCHRGHVDNDVTAEQPIYFK